MSTKKQNKTSMRRRDFLAAAGAVVLTAGYILWLIRRVYLGREKEEYASFPDVSSRETFILIPLAILCIALGIFPMQTETCQNLQQRSYLSYNWVSTASVKVLTIIPRHFYNS